jgi:hypothetical protein
MLFIFRFPFSFTFTFCKHKQQILCFEKTIKVHQYEYPMKSQVTWHKTGRGGTGRDLSDRSVRVRLGGDGSCCDGSCGDGSGGDGSGGDGLGGDGSGSDGSGGNRLGGDGSVGDGSVGNESVAKKVAADPSSFKWFMFRA